MRHVKRHTALRFFTALLILLLVLSLASCGGGSGGGVSDTSPSSEASDQDFGLNANGGEAGELMNTAQQESDSSKNEGDGVSRPYGDDVKLILHASLELQATDFDDAAARLDRLVEAHEGYYESSEVRMGDYNSSSDRAAFYTVRIPQKNYDSFLQMSETVCHVTDKRESAEDVGSQYFDAESRLKTLRAKQDRLLAFLKQAGNMEEIIQLEDALGDVQYQIDQYASELTRYDSLIDYSTIEITLRQVSRLTSSVSDQASFGDRLASAFQEGTLGARDALSVLLIGCAYLAVPLTIVLVAVCVVLFLRRKFKKGQPSETFFKRKGKSAHPETKTIGEDGRGNDDCNGNGEDRR